MSSLKPIEKCQSSGLTTKILCEAHRPTNKSLYLAHRRKLKTRTNINKETTSSIVVKNTLCKTFFLKKKKPKILYVITIKINNENYFNFLYSFVFSFSQSN